MVFFKCEYIKKMWKTRAKYKYWIYGVSIKKCVRIFSWKNVEPRSHHIQRNY